MNRCPWCYAPGGAVFVLVLDPDGGRMRALAECRECGRSAYARWEMCADGPPGRRVACFLEDHSDCAPEWSEVG